MSWRVPLVMDRVPFKMFVMNPSAQHNFFQGEKWIATIWMWNGPRSTPHFNAQEPLNQKSSMIASKPESIIVMFSLSDEFLDVTADIRLLDPLQEVRKKLLGVFFDNCN